MNPISAPAPSVNRQTLRDIAPSKPTTPKENLGAEIVHDIPVKNPSILAEQSTPPPPKPIEEKEEEDKDLDVILKDVNTTVRQAENSPEERFAHLTGVRKQAAIKKAKIDEAHHGSPPILATGLAILVAGGLILGVLVVFG